jgi:arylsulfatase A
MKRFFSLIYFTSILTLFSYKLKAKEEKPNVILIMTDDMGYECLSTYGCQQYETPNLDKLARKGVQFQNCVSQPLSTPSRVKIMTGLRNYRNYDYFGHLRNGEYTFGNLMKDAGYETCIAGKWQLNGLAYKDKIKDWNDKTRPNKFGFDEYCLWQLTIPGNKGGRFANPKIEQNGKFLNTTIDDYGPDVFNKYVLDFIERKKDDKFFIYYPMVLVHDPFVPTPDSEEWKDASLRNKQNKKYFKDMVEYADKLVGNVIAKLESHGLLENTILIFTGDNGTHYSIDTRTKDRNVKGGKGKTTDAGTHVPMIVSWPEKIKEGKVHNELIEFSDFFATFSDLVGSERFTDGKSFYPLLKGGDYEPRSTAFVHYDPRWGKRVNQYRNQFLRTLDYKYYFDGSFYDLNKDVYEKSKIQDSNLSEKEKEVKDELKSKMKKFPEFK